LENKDDMQPYIPINILEAIMEERRPDPRVIAASGYPLRKPRRSAREALGALLVRMGHLIEGNNATTTAAGSPSAA
jgi:hypothetical protein